MTEAQWPECNLLRPMLQYLQSKASSRKLRLFAVACCRRIEHHLIDGRSHRAIQISERVADAVASRPELREAESAAWLAVRSDPVTVGVLVSAARAAATLTTEEAFTAAMRTAGEVSEGLAEEAEETSNNLASAMAPSEELYFQVEAAEQKNQCDLIREIFGNPFRSITVDPRSLSSTVIDLATAIYHDRAFDRMPILADALMDAGCDNDEIIAHCRSDGPHVRGCWVVDLLLGKT